jgi:hypothetical protein
MFLLSIAAQPHPYHVLLLLLLSPDEKCDTPMSRVLNTFLQLHIK